MPEPPRPKRASLWLAFVAAALFHGGLTCYFVSLPAIFGSAALEGEDFDLHAGQVFRVVEGLERWGKSWVYDVSLLAGQPEGTILDAGSKGWELWTYALCRLGVSRPVAFNSYVLAVMLGCPVAVFTGARLLRLGAGASLLAAAMASSLWFFDSFFHWAWWVGMVSYAASAYAVLVPFGSFFRYVEDGAPGPLVLAISAIALGLVLLVHPYAFFALVAPLGVLYGRAFRRLSRARHLAIAGMALVAIAMNAYWLRSAWTHWHYVLDSAYYAQGGAPYLITDFLDLLRDGSDTGVIGTRTGFRVLYLALATAGLVVWQRARDRRFLPVLTAIVVPLGLAYFGVYLPGGGQTQPYRHVLAASCFATLPAASFVAHAWQERARFARPAAIALALGALAVVVLQHLLVEASYFVPRALPEAKPAYDGSDSPLSKYGFLTLPRRAYEMSHVHYGLPHDPRFEAATDAMLDWLEHNVPKGGRVLIDHGPLGERVARRTELEVMGGFLERNLAHAEANFFRRYDKKPCPPAELAAYLDEYAIGWVVLSAPRADVEHAPALLERVANIAGFRVYRTRRPVPLLRGRGAVHAHTNVIRVVASDPTEPLELSYHFHEALRCEPNCRVERRAVPFDRVGLIRVPAPHPRDFAIVNEYR